MQTQGEPWAQQAALPLRKQPRGEVEPEEVSEPL